MSSSSNWAVERTLFEHSHHTNRHRVGFRSVSSWYGLWNVFVFMIWSRCRHLMESANQVTIVNMPVTPDDLARLVNQAVNQNVVYTCPKDINSSVRRTCILACWEWVEAVTTTPGFRLFFKSVSVYRSRRVQPCLHRKATQLQNEELLLWIKNLCLEEIKTRKANRFDITSVEFWSLNWSS